MTTAEKDLKKYWVMFAVSLLLTIGFLIVLPEWFWVMLPPLLTSFVLAKDWI
jgi:hypothetical protein